jgi:biotin operon repressor
MIVTWAEHAYAGGGLVAVSRHAPAGPVCILGCAAVGDAVSVSFCRVTAKHHEDVLAVLAGAPKSGREVARALGISPTTAIARLTDLRDWGMARSRTAGRSIMWSLADGAM